MTTTNRVKAAPCVVTDRHAERGRARAVVVNAGNANACTGDVGLRHAEDTCAELAELLDCEADEVLPLSTGIIGVPLPIDTLLDGLPEAVADLGRDGAAGTRAAEAICTTDTHAKQAAAEVHDDQGRCRVGGMAKGAGMIEPAMATMLAVVTTDAPIDTAVLRPIVRQAAQRTFNRISVDACGSTNDTVAMLATGAAARPPGLAALQTGIEAVFADLARQLVADAEGGGRTAELTVTGARSTEEALTLARAIAGSTLFRAALHGADPNWGRILAAMGASDVDFSPAKVDVLLGGVTVCRFGSAATFDEGQVAALLERDVVDVEVDLGLGPAQVTMLAAELSPAYVAENAYYTT